MTGIGPMISVGQVRRAAEDTLKLWLPSTLVEAARQAGLDPANRQKVPAPRSWRRVPDARFATDDQLPLVSISSGGLVDQPDDDGDGVFFAQWGLVVAVELRQSSYEETADLVGLYCAAIRAVLTQHPIFDGTRWLGEDYALAPPEKSRSLGAGFVEFLVDVGNVLDITAGLDDPPANPFPPIPDRPEVEDVIVLERPLD